MASPAGFSVTPMRADQFFHLGRRQHWLAKAPAAKVDALARGFAPDIILCFDLLSAWLTAQIPARRIVWLGDLRFQTALYHAIYAAREHPLKAVHIPSNWLACRAWKKIYREILQKADQVVVSSYSSIQALVPLGIESEYEPYPWPESTEETHNGAVRCPPDTPTFLFFGSLGGLGSRSALHLLTREVFPLLRRCWGKGGFRVLIAGRGTLPDWAQQAISGKPEFETLGFVEDLDDLLARCHAVLVPIDVPVGNRSRILAAMARGSLVITHANAALGNPDLVDGETCYLAASPREFVDRMQRAVRDRHVVPAITARALECFRSRFGVDAAGAKMLARIDALVSAEEAKPHLNSYHPG